MMPVYVYVLVRKNVVARMCACVCVRFISVVVACVSACVLLLSLQMHTALRILRINEYHKENEKSKYGKEARKKRGENGEI